MLNPFAILTLFISLLLLIPFGGVLIFIGLFQNKELMYLIGIFNFVLASCILIKGWQLTPPSPNSLSIVNILGVRTGTYSKGWALLPKPVFSLTTIPMQQIDKDFEIKDIRCVGDDPSQPNQHGPLVSGVVSISILANRYDLERYDDIQRDEGVMKILDDTLEEMVQKIIARDRMRWIDAETLGDQIAQKLFKELTGNPMPAQKTDIMKPDNIRWINRMYELGCFLVKINCKFLVEEDVRKAAAGRAREVEERNTELFDMETDMQKAQVMYQGFFRMGRTNMTLEACLERVMAYKAIAAGHGQAIQGNIFQGLMASSLGRQQQNQQGAQAQGQPQQGNQPQQGQGRRNNRRRGGP